MSNHRPAGYFSALAGWLKILLPVLIGATGQVAPAAELVLSAELGRMQYRMAESGASGQLLNREEGTLPTQHLKARWEQASRFMELGAWHGGQQISYVGLTQASLPLLTQTELKMQGWQWRLGQYWPWLQSSNWGVALGLEHLRIDRHILPALGSLPLRETLDSTRAVLGLESKTEFSSVLGWPLQLAVGVDLLRTLRQELAVDSFGLYDPLRLLPAPSTDGRATLRLTLAPNASSQVWFAVQRENFNPGSTAFQSWTRMGVPASTVRYPGSRQSMQQISVGASWQF